MTQKQDSGMADDIHAPGEHARGEGDSREEYSPDESTGIPNGQNVKPSVPIILINNADDENGVPLPLSAGSPPLSPEIASDSIHTAKELSDSEREIEPTVDVVQTEASPPSTVTVGQGDLDTGTAGSALDSQVTDFYRNKNVLLTGATGFVGKAILWKLIEAIGTDLGKVYVFIRNGGSKRSKIGRPSERLRNEILNNKAFISLRAQMGEAEFDAIVANKIIPINADIVSPSLALTPTDRAALIKDVQVVIHCAASQDYHERLDLAVETNTLGTMRLMDLADECTNMQAFVHMSLGYQNTNMTDTRVQERVYPMELGDPEALLKVIVDLELPDFPKMIQRILAHYPSIYTFTKILTEHLILKRADANRVEEVQGGKVQWPIAIIRATQVGAGAYEPLPGWVDGVTGASSAVFLLGHGIQAIQQDIGQLPADIVPVDYLARIVLGCPAFMKPPGTKFLLAYNEILHDSDKADNVGSPLPYSIVPCFPLIYHVSGTTLNTIPWYEAYDAIRHYWTRNTRIALPSSAEYFVSKSIFKPRVFAKNQLSQSIASVTAAMNANNTQSQYGTRPTVKPTNRTIELASQIVEANQPFLRRQWIFDDINTRTLKDAMENDKVFALAKYQTIDWFNYMIHYCFGVHIFIAQASLELRDIALPPGWDCALYSKNRDIRNSVVEKQIESAVFSVADIKKRTERMVALLIELLESPEGPELRDKKKNEEWVNDFDASLDDWCHDDSNILKNASQQAILGRWGKHVNDEIIKVAVLNDKRVGDSVRQIIESSGVPMRTVVEEASKILQRIRERTQPPYIWFAGSLLDTLFKRLFVSIRISEDSLAQLRREIAGKNVVYVPVSKTILDHLLLWYICLRYRLPLPAIVCDEGLALLGPISDIFRTAGAYFVRRDQLTRSPLNTAVTAAYTEALLHEHGAIAMFIEKARSRTGRVQTVYRDGLIEMILEASLERHQFSSEASSGTPLSTPTSPQPARSNSFPVTPRRETVFVPLHFTYEKIPEVRILIDQVLDQKQPRAKENGEVSIPSPASSTFLRPSTSVAVRVASKDKAFERGKYGRVYIGIGKALDVRETVEQSGLALDKEDELVNLVATTIQRRHYETANVSPVALVAATVLFGRLSGGIIMADLYEHVGWLRKLVLARGIPLDWQDYEDVEGMVAYSLNMLEARHNIIIDGKRTTEASNVRVIEHADNVMALSYMANQLVDVLLPEAMFSIVYLSAGQEKIARSDLSDGFNFLIGLFRGEFIYPWDHDEKFKQLLQWSIEMQFVSSLGETELKKNATMDENPLAYTHICLVASLLYPTLDAYWITTCSLSALRDLPYLPRKIVPILAQWIAAHLISGRRTIYREVLSTEATQNAVDNYLGSGLIQAVHPKSQLSPEAQILLLELDVTTNEDLVMVSKGESSQESNSEEHRQGVADIASLCSTIEKYRFGTNAQLDTYRHNAQVFEKCRNQIRTILRADQSYATQHGIQLSRDEDQMIQLVYALKASASSNASLSSEFESGRNPRRVSQAYNLTKS